MIAQLEEFKQAIEENLNSLLDHPSFFAPSLYEGGRYILLGGGKRIRPLLTLSATAQFRPDLIGSALLPACALEMIHTYSLIHDDLPCMDDDDFRRGRPTLHKVYTEGHAVLIGDYLLTYAFEVLTRSPLLSDRQKLALIQVLSVAAGGEGMIGGQVMDIEKSPHIEQMHSRKTAALFQAAAAFGGIIAEVSDETLNNLKNFGTEFGKLFQMVDDVLDKDHPISQETAKGAAQIHFLNTLSLLETLPGDSSLLKSLAESIYFQMIPQPSEELIPSL